MDWGEKLIFRTMLILKFNIKCFLLPATFAPQHDKRISIIIMRRQCQFKRAAT